MAIGICKYPGCGHRTVKHDNCAYTFKWLCEEHRNEPIKIVRLRPGRGYYEPNRPTLRDIFNAILKRSA